MQKYISFIDPVCTWSRPAWGYPAMIAGSPFWSGGGGFSSNWWQACFPHPFSWLEINCSQTDFLQKPFSYELFLLKPFSRDFRSPPPLQIFLLDWDEFPLATAVAGVEKEKEFDIPSQFLKYSDPLWEIITFLQSVLVFLLSGHLEADPMRIIFLPACEHMLIFLVEPQSCS